MKRESNTISTKENPIENFSKELYPIEKEDREIMALENTCNILSTVLKIEAVVTLIVITFSIIVSKLPSNTESQEEYKQASISTEID